MSQGVLALWQHTGLVRLGHGIESWSSQTFIFFPAAAMLFYIIKNYFSKFLYFPKFYNHTSLYGLNASDVSVYPTSQVCSSTMLVLLIVGNLKVRF
jgi:hypothetical protein